LRKGKYIGTVNVAETEKEELSEMMVGRPVSMVVEKSEPKPGEVVLAVENLSMKGNGGKNALNNVSFNVRAGEIVCIAGIDGNGQSELVYAITGMDKFLSGKVILKGQDVSKKSIRKHTTSGMAHIPEDRQKHGLVLQFTLAQNLVLQSYFEKQFQTFGFIKFDSVEKYALELIEKYDIRSGQGTMTLAGNMSGGNQQKIILAREIDRDPELLIAVQPTRGLDVGAIENIHKQLVAQRDSGKAVLLVSLELEEVMNVSDRILVMYEGEIVGELDPKTTDLKELGLYMAGTKRGSGYEKAQ
jgi:simple sugar transport system ATP-binding protein